MPWFRDLYEEAVWESDSLRPNEKLVAKVYADHAGNPEKPDNDVSWVVWRRLSQRTGIRSKDALNRAVQGLVASGWLVLVEGRKQWRSPRYRLVIPTPSEVRGTDHCEQEKAPPEVRETDDNPVDEGTSEVRLADNYEGAEVRETTAEVRQTTTRGTADGPDSSKDSSTTDDPLALRPQPQNAKPPCRHVTWTFDHYCVACDLYEPCADCRRLARIGPHMRCHQHQAHQAAS